ncbi:methyltransferase domain-containing protein [Phaeobacter sp. QD34_3]|uniref:CheR family methyltransferase n=1 Tax=unclassified Phaeobacter TaxID=2621772 RepID=UPI00237FB6C6|nr:MULTISPECIES: CheR family methyltransferase [unclassified Phaeobacter]MDE4134844.1 methyltransferase domain-containing protein [Phaeobacter sp. QD34_3]MDE4137753.1 methyltransferase domain-containing protein [Phaeobacter sp. QD34_24]MDE4173684.1 methyltransferase domain-containing protein [Phaeobacter sp. PT47_59]
MNARTPIDPKADAFSLTDQDFEAIAQFAYKHFGLSMSSSKKPLVSARLARRLRQQNVVNFKDYLARLNGPNSESERSSLLSLLTTNVTQFFREPHHFETMRKDVLPGLIKKAREGGRVRIWSAGCSKGPEPYTLAMIIHDMCPDVNRLNFKILGTDIDPVVVQAATAAKYPAEEFAQIPAEYRKLVPKLDADGRLPESIRSMVTLGVLNLIEPFPFKGKFDVIFCRNVAIYFDTPTQQKVWQAFQRSLEPGGYLFIGHSERMSGPAAKHMKTAGITTYIHTPSGGDAR